MTVKDEADLEGVKRKLGVPSTLASCHTAVVEDYVVEGHVPASVIRRLLAERPDDVAGLAVPGMPVGSPGMESPGREPEPYRVLAFDREGNVRVYARP